MFALWEGDMKIGFIGLGNVGAKLAGSVLRNGFDLTVHDLSSRVVEDFVQRGAGSAVSPRELAEAVDVVITCLPSPAACATVVEGENGLVEGLSAGKIWMEMSTTDAEELVRLAGIVAGKGAAALECPVSGGCHRAATGNISIFVGGERETLDRAMPLLQVLGRRILHTGELGSASILKVMTNYLATANLLTMCEALTAMKAAGMDMRTTLEAIQISSGNSFVAETEGVTVLNGTRDIDFSVDLVLKDIGLFQQIAERNAVPLQVSPLLIETFRQVQNQYGEKANSNEVIRLLEDPTGLSVLADGLPLELVDDEPEEPGYEIRWT
jgi:3-hydroxyisobutyrate dehydrogenase